MNIDIITIIIIVVIIMTVTIIITIITTIYINTGWNVFRLNVKAGFVDRKLETENNDLVFYIQY
jgi:hypothetical protein